MGREEGLQRIARLGAPAGLLELAERVGRSRHELYMQGARLEAHHHDIAAFTVTADEHGRPTAHDVRAEHLDLRRTTRSLTELLRLGWQTHPTGLWDLPPRTPIVAPDEEPEDRTPAAQDAARLGRRLLIELLALTAARLDQPALTLTGRRDLMSGQEGLDLHGPAGEPLPTPAGDGAWVAGLLETVEIDVQPHRLRLPHHWTIALAPAGVTVSWRAA